MPRIHLRRVFLCAGLLAVAWRLIRYLLNFPLWGDEAYLAVNFWTRNFADMFRPLEYHQIAPPGFMGSTLAVVRQFGDSEYALRLAPLLAGLAAVPLFLWLARQLPDRRGAVLAASVFCAAYFPMRHSADLKPYATDLLAALVLLGLTIAIRRRPTDVGRWLLAALVAAVTVWFSFPAVFIAATPAILFLPAVFFRQPRVSRAGWVAYVGLVAASFGAEYVLVIREQARAGFWLFEIPMWTRAFPPVDRPWGLPLWLITIHTGELLAYPVGGKHGLSAIPFLLAVAGAVRLYRRDRFLVALLLIPVGLTFGAAVIRAYPYGGSTRTSLYLAPTFCLLIGMGVSCAVERWFAVRRAGATRGWLVGMLVIVAAGISRDAIRPYKQPSDLRARTALREMQETRDADERWIIFNALTNANHAPNLYAWGGSAARFRYYVHRYGPPATLWSPPPDRSSAAPGNGPVRLIRYVDNKAPFPQEQWERYRHAIERDRGSARSTDLTRLGEDELIEAVLFAGRSAARPGGGPPPSSPAR